MSQHSADVRQIPLYKTAEGVSSLDFDQFQPVTSRSVFGRRQGVVVQEEEEEEEEKRGRKKMRMHLKKINTRSAENSRSLKEVEEEEDGLFVQQQQQQQQQLTPEPLSNQIELVDRYDPHFFHEQQQVRNLLQCQKSKIMKYFYIQDVFSAPSPPNLPPISSHFGDGGGELHQPHSPLPPPPPPPPPYHEAEHPSPTHQVLTLYFFILAQF